MYWCVLFICFYYSIINHQDHMYTGSFIISHFRGKTVTSVVMTIITN